MDPGFVGTTANTVWQRGSFFKKKNIKLGTELCKGAGKRRTLKPQLINFSEDPLLSQAQ